MVVGAQHRLRSQRSVMAPTRAEWADVYARQSHSDWLVYNSLINDSGIARCHALHYLQMSCEKIAKAYRFRDTRTAAEDLASHHVGFTEFLNAFLVSPSVTRRQAKSKQWRSFPAMAREIEKLSPAVDRASHPANSEYPWYDGARLIAPCEYDYPNLAILSHPDGIHFLKVIELAIQEFSTLSIH